MSETEGPRPDVLAERISGLNSRFNALEKRIDNLATKDELIQIIGSRDLLSNTQLSELRDDIKGVTKALSTERAERITGDKDNEERANRARTFALSALGLIVTVVLGLIALINQIGGGPT